jgi:hypothetical protein
MWLLLKMSAMQDITALEAPTGEDLQVLQTTLVIFALKATTVKSVLRPQLNVPLVTILMLLAFKQRTSVNSVRMDTIAML